MRSLLIAVVLLLGASPSTAQWLRAGNNTLIHTGDRMEVMLLCAKDSTSMLTFKIKKAVSRDPKLRVVTLVPDTATSRASATSFPVVLSRFQNMVFTREPRAIVNAMRQAREVVYVSMYTGGAGVIAELSATSDELELLESYLNSCQQGQLRS